MKKQHIMLWAIGENQTEIKAGWGCNGSIVPLPIATVVAELNKKYSQANKKRKSYTYDEHDQLIDDSPEFEFIVLAVSPQAALNDVWVTLKLKKIRVTYHSRDVLQTW